MLVSSLSLFWSCAVVWGPLEVMWFYSVAFDVNSFSRAFVPFGLCLAISLFLQCDSAWWLPLTGLSCLPYNWALVHRVVMVTLCARLVCLRLPLLVSFVFQDRPLQYVAVVLYYPESTIFSYLNS